MAVAYSNHNQTALLILPALLDSLPDSLRVFFAVVLVEVRGFDVGGRASVGIVKQTEATSLAGLILPLMP